MRNYHRICLDKKIAKMARARRNKYLRFAMRSDIKAHVVSNVARSVYPRGETSPNGRFL